MRETFFIAAAESLALPTGLITAAILTRHLGPSDYALLSIAAGMVAWLQWTIGSVWARATIKGVAVSETPLPTAAEFMRVYAWSGLTASVGLALGADLLATALANPKLAPLMRWYALDIAIFSLTHGYRSVHAGLGLFRGRAAGTAARWITRLILVVLAVVMGLGVLGAIWANIGASIVDLLINRWRTPVRWKLRGAVPHGILRESSPLVANGVLMRLFERMDLFFLSALGVSQTIVGAYGAAQNLSIAGSIITSSASPVLLYVMSRAVRAGAPGEAQDAGSQAARAAVCGVPVFAAAAVHGPLLARAIFGAEFEFIGRVMGMLILTIPATILLSFLQCALIAFDRVRTVVVLTGFLLLGAVAGHFALIPRFGAAGAAFTTLGVAAIGCLASAIPAARLHVRVPALTVLRSTVVSAAVFTAAWLMESTSWGTFAGLVAGAIAIQILAGELSREEWRRAFHWIRSYGKS